MHVYVYCLSVDPASSQLYDPSESGPCALLPTPPTHALFGRAGGIEQIYASGRPQSALAQRSLKDHVPTAYNAYRMRAVRIPDCEQSALTFSHAGATGLVSRLAPLRVTLSAGATTDAIAVLRERVTCPLALAASAVRTLSMSSQTETL